MNELVFQLEQFGQLRQDLLSQGPEEAAAVLVGQVHRSPKGTRVLIREIIRPTSDAYINQSTTRIDLSPIFLAPILKRARTTKSSLIFVHTHPQDQARPQFSAVDDQGERILLPAVFGRAPDGPHGSLVIGPHGYSGRLIAATGGTDEIDSIREVGGNVVVNAPQQSKALSRAELKFDRNVRAFGKEGQARLRQLTVGLVGLGGTGSIVAQQLAHLGVGRFVLIDTDVVEETNLNRVVGATPPSVGSRKVDVAATMIHGINEKVGIEPIFGSVLLETHARRLLECDFVFSCTDSHGSRAVLNQLAYQYLVPVIDMGLRIDAVEERVVAMGGRVQMLAPGLSCLLCQELLDPEEVRRDLLTAAQRRADPYIHGQAEPQPSIISINSTIASIAVTMFLSATVGIPHAARHLIYRVTEGVVRSVRPLPVSNCIVCSNHGSLSRGDGWAMNWRLE